MSNLQGLIGEKLSHSYSAVIHKLVLEKLGINGEYNLFEIEPQNLGKSMEAFKVLGCKGINVTIPYKIAVMSYMDDISEEAKNIGAINTIEFDGNRLKGYNTDYYGFGLTLKKNHIDVLNKNAVILGTGGASKAVVRYILDEGASNITYVSRHPEKIKQSDFEVISYEKLREIKSGDIIVNCTPCGMYPNLNNCPINKNVLSKFNTAVDLIYNPEYTLFLKMGKEMGLKIANGLYMLVAQAVAAEEIWHKKNISIETINEIYDELVKIEYNK
ncbi:shikimate dehydrogenase [Clostridium ragsdalei P11]|uniref:Shikimate dehydrogenase (NADP(+)) n=1 Tax=Clostridium ragsdalei P11 TaxID=1353534 RepID=A0A1A6AJV9_9CLOT|nr:shikimate dehydrogenase [Clostridium ragsdalei]OBR90334.1 shikimate dehydrogenase [Clostridium ragsdalei P11]